MGANVRGCVDPKAGVIMADKALKLLWVKSLEQFTLMLTKLAAHVSRILVTRSQVRILLSIKNIVYKYHNDKGAIELASFSNQSLLT